MDQGEGGSQRENWALKSSAVKEKEHSQGDQKSLER